MGIKYQLEAYDPSAERRRVYYTGRSLWECFKVYRIAKGGGCKYFTITWWIGR